MYCILVEHHALRWWDAAEYCKVHHHAELVRIIDHEMMQAVRTVIWMVGDSTKYWVGLTKLEGHGWAWADGMSSFPFMNFWFN